ncbi:MAG TPA: hypothetical protein VN493_21110 [Thermoanaerobaculia bacterium]|nr:hypothetical protein [Thermoanaerobaculia bacterium]
MDNLQSAKIRAALVMIAWLATVASLWGMTAAGRRAIEKDTGCEAKETRNRVVQLQKESAEDEVLAALSKECVRRSVKAQVVEDFLFLLAYGALNFVLFLFAGTLRGAGRALALLGLLLAIAMAAGDAFENLRALDVIGLVEQGASRQEIQEPLRLLRSGALVKWGALALASALLGMLWPRARFSWIPRLLGLGAAVAVAAGLMAESWEGLAGSMAALAAFWLAGLVHAVAVAVTVEPGPAPAPVPAPVPATRSEDKK